MQHICTLVILKPEDQITGSHAKFVNGDRHLNKLQVGRQHSHLIILSNTLTIAILVASELTLLVIQNAFLLFIICLRLVCFAQKNEEKKRIGGDLPSKTPRASSRHVSGVLSRTPTPGSLFMNL